MDHVYLLAGIDGSLEVPYFDYSTMVSDYAETRHLSFHEFRHHYELDSPQLRKYGWNQIQGTFTRDSFTQRGSRCEQQINALLQELLFFRVLCEFFGTPGVMDRSEMKANFVVKNENYEEIIVTNRLPDMLRKVAQEYPRNQQALQEVTRRRELVDEMIQYYNSFLALDHQGNQTCPLNDRVTLSIGVLASALSGAICTIGGFTNMTMVGTPRLIGELFKCNFRCPTSQFLLEKASLGPQGQYLACLLGPAVHRRNHELCGIDSQRCFANDIDPELPPTRHAPESCKCSFSDESAIKDQVERIVQANKGHPVIRVRPQPSNVLEMISSEELKGKRYVAISHVWADGLGCKSNSLPLCQLKRLQSLSSSTVGEGNNQPVYFWIDTICIPRKNTKLRKLAIGRMHLVYKEASAVLVIDAEISENSLASVDSEPAVNLMRLLMSNWMRRMWTLQEGVVGQKLHFVFPNGILDVDDLFARTAKQVNSVLNPCSNATIMLMVAPLIRMTQLRVMPRQDRLRDTWNSMQWRTTSRQPDEAVCIAIMLDFDSEEIANVQTKGKEFEHLYVIMRKRGIKLLFGMMTTAAARMQIPGLTWAPETFFSTPGTAVNIDAGNLWTLTEDGAEFEARICSLYMPQTALQGGFHVLDEASKAVYDIEYNKLARIHGSKAWSDLQAHRYGQILVIFRIRPTEDFGHIALMAAIRSRQKGNINVSYIGRIFFQKSKTLSWERMQAEANMDELLQQLHEQKHHREQAKQFFATESDHQDQIHGTLASVATVWIGGMPFSLVLGSISDEQRRIVLTD